MSTHDESATLLAPGAGLERLTTGATWAEGPLWLPESRQVRFSDVRTNRILQWDYASGEASVFREAAEYANGRALDHRGNVVQCSHGRRGLEQEGPHGARVLVDRWEGGRFNSPNDVVVARDGSIWFTDPPYGLQPGGEEGYPGPQDYEGCFVFRHTPETGETTPVVTSVVHPNGIAFSLDERILYVSDTGHDAGHLEACHILAFPLRDMTVEGPGTVFAAPPNGASDGFTLDREGRLWTSAGDGVYVYASDGGLLARLPVPETVSNVCFGGDAGNELFITATTSLYRIRTLTTGPSVADFRVS